jgi:hypothetical protein
MSIFPMTRMTILHSDDVHNWHNWETTIASVKLLAFNQYLFVCFNQYFIFFVSINPFHFHVAVSACPIANNKFFS